MSKLTNNTEAIRALLDTANQLPEDGYYEGYDKGKTEGLTEGRAEGQEIGYADALAKRTDLVATANGEYTPSEDSTGFKSVSVNVTGKAAQIVDRTVTEITEEDLQGITKIGKAAFQNCEYLKSVTFPEILLEIGDYAFNRCSSLTQINIPETVTSIGQYSFAYCSGITNVTIPNGISELFGYTFGHCTSLESVILPSSITNLDYAAFYSSTNLKEVTIKATTPPTLQGNTFYRCPLKKITVPYGSGDAYKSATNWSAHADKIVEGDV